MKPLDVLFLCETNAAASLVAEALANRLGDVRLRAFSAGRVPALAMLREVGEVLLARGVPVDGLEPKPWSIFALPGAPRPDLVVDLATVTWTDPRIAALSGGAVMRWPLRDAGLSGRRAERRATAEEIATALEAKILRELMPLVDLSTRDPLPVPAAAVSVPALGEPFRERP